MPTENRSTMLSVPRELIEQAMLACFEAGFGIPHDALSKVLDQAATQHQSDPIMLTAVATLADDGDGGLEPNWLLEGGTAELFAGMTLLVAENAPDLRSEDGSAKLYAHPAPADPGEVEHLKAALESACNLAHARTVERDTLSADVETMRRKNNEYCDEVERLRELSRKLAQGSKDQLSIIESLRAELEEWKKRCQYNADTAHGVGHERDTLRAQLAERDALLRDINKRHSSGVDFDLPADLAARVKALSARLDEGDGPHPIRVLGQEAYSTLVGMVEYCLNQRVCMGMDEGFKSFDPEEEHDFVKELRTFVALSASAEPSAPDVDPRECRKCGSLTADKCKAGGCWFDREPSAPVGRDERAEFEAWAKEQDLSVTRTPNALCFHNGTRRSAGDYIDLSSLCSYAAWCARAALERNR